MIIKPRRLRWTRRLVVKEGMRSALKMIVGIAGYHFGDLDVDGRILLK
jgi:hypothetical protein